MLRKTSFVFGFAVLGLFFTTRPAEAVQPDLTWIFISDMHCEDCCSRIRKKLYTVPGVVKVQTHLDAGFAVITPVRGRAISARSLWESVEQIEFTPVKLQGPSGVYTEKPSR